MATYIWALSGGRIDRETEWFLLWELPLSRGRQYQHAAMVANGAPTVRPGFSMLDRMKQLEKEDDEHE